MNDNIILSGNENVNNTKINTQVFQATHDGAGTRLPLMKRSFISFTYGGKNIEDFGVISIIESNSLERPLYAEFEDNTSSLNTVDGQLFWGTHFKANELSFALFTDEITERQLAFFAQWFKPGVCRELILAEHPNRAIMARVKSQPIYKVLPFEKHITSKLYGAKTSTTAYRGKIELTFAMDDPFWYALDNILDSEVEGKWRNPSIEDIDQQLELISDSKDALKIIEEDGIPTRIALTNDVLIGNNLYVSIRNKPARTARATEIDVATSDEVPEIFIGAWLGGRSDVNNSNYGFNLAANTNKYFYYAGTAPGTPILEFDINFNTDSLTYSSTIASNFVPIDYDSKPYNSIWIESSTGVKELRITTPSLITAYNQAINILQNNGLTQLEKIEKIRTEVNHPKVRQFAINNQLNHLFKSTTVAHIVINCKTGESIITYQLQDYEGLYGGFNYSLLTESAGDMIRSNYLKIEDRNYPDEFGYIQQWTQDHPEYSHKLWHNISSGLIEVKFTYKYMYL